MRTGDIWIQGEKGGRYRTIIYLDDDARHYYGLYLDSRKDDYLWISGDIENHKEKSWTHMSRISA